MTEEIERFVVIFKEKDTFLVGFTEEIERFVVIFKEKDIFPVGFAEKDSFKIYFDCKYSPAIGETYSGPTRVEPSYDGTILQTEGKVVINNIIIDPIPKNYGLISWDGSILTVS